ncbi:MAG TPA: heparan-alpha-glucosaminide N-acetyltransferase domain-containing protein [Candidatus Limnocylindrales bacterium]|jgi:uncharacterized membrane protein|nr:heparan-alpha-glucosaminide N-acetyltransferase domain-containing protein [Candidatus Limnocylindrales bacterium]
MSGATAAPSTTTTPDGRIRAFDLARGLAIVFMVMVHVLGHYGNDASWASPLGQAVIFLGGPTAAPVFMFLMGASLAFSRRASTVGIARRGLWLLFLAYTLHVLRGALPATLGLASGYVTEADIWPYTPGTLLTLVDIHQMAGLALLVIAGLTVLFTLSGGPALRAVLVGLAVVVGLVSPLLWGTTTGIGPVDLGLALLWGTEWNVFFPLFPWLVYPLVGFAYGRTLVGQPDRRRFVRRMGIVGVVIMLAGVAVIAVLHPAIGVEDYWRQRPGVLLAILGLVLGWLALADVVVARVRSNPVFDRFYGWSARVTSMYCIHWILIGWGVALVGHRDLELPAVLVAMGIVLLLADRITATLPFLRGPRSRAPSNAERPSTLVPAEA